LEGMPFVFLKHDEKNTVRRFTGPYRFYQLQNQVAQDLAKNR
jgi:hypothetical protein